MSECIGSRDIVLKSVTIVSEIKIALIELILVRQEHTVNASICLELKSSHGVEWASTARVLTSLTTFVKEQIVRTFELKWESGFTHLISKISYILNLLLLLDIWNNFALKSREDLGIHLSGCINAIVHTSEGDLWVAGVLIVVVKELTIF